MNGDTNKNSILKSINRSKTLYLMFLPYFITLILFAYKPMWGILIAFQDFNIYKGMSGSEWIGFTNFMTFFRSPYLFRTIKNTIAINIYNLVFTYPAPIILALMINEVKNKYYKKGVQTITYLPHFISTVIVAGMITNFLSPSTGVVNVIIEKLGFNKIYFLMKPEWFRAILISLNIWKETGFNTILYMSALLSIDPQLYEACTIDGGNKLKQLIHITIPGILPTIVITLIMQVGNLLNVGYEAIILLYQPATYEVSDVIGTYVYRTGLTEGNYGLSTAVGLFNSVISILLVAFANFVSKRLTETSLW